MTRDGSLIRRRALTEVEPDLGEPQGDGMKCCKKKPKPPGFPGPDLPEADCLDENYYSCIGCPPGQGKMVWVYPDCSRVVRPCESTTECVGEGPIDPDESEFQQQ